MKRWRIEILVWNPKSLNYDLHSKQYVLTLDFIETPDSNLNLDKVSVYTALHLVTVWTTRKKEGQ